MLRSFFKRKFLNLIAGILHQPKILFLDEPTVGVDVQSILMASSANVYGNGYEGEIDESFVENPANDYAVSKLAMEKMAALWKDKLPIFIARPFNYTGVGHKENFLIPKIVSHYKRGAEVIELGNLDVYREFGDVRNVANIYTQLLKVNPVGQTINICTGVKYSLTDVIQMCENICGHKVRVEVNPDFVRPNEVKVLVGNPSKLNALLDGYDQKSFFETLTWMLS